MSVDLPAPTLTNEELLRLRTFSPHVGDEFAVERGAERVALTLAEASNNARTHDIAGEQFSLIFAAGPEKPLQQGLHDFEHPMLGRFELFITPVLCPHREIRWYEAVINRAAVL